MRLRHDRVLYLDTELTCWSEDYDGIAVTLSPEIIQIGLVEVDTKNLEVVREANFYVLPYKSGTALSQYCTELTGITSEILREKAHPLHEVIATIIHEFGPLKKMAFSWGDDGAAFPIDKDPFHHVDLSVLYAMRSGNTKPISLPAAREQCGAQFEGRQHDALNDARNLAALHRLII